MAASFLAHGISLTECSLRAHPVIMQKEGTIPDADIMDALNSGLAFSESLVAGYQPNNGGEPLVVNAELYTKGAEPVFVLIFDTEIGRPVAEQSDRAVAVLLKTRPDLRLERCFWAYEDQTAPQIDNVLFYFFRIKLTGTGFSRSAAGQLPKRYMHLLLKK